MKEIIKNNTTRNLFRRADKKKIIKYCKDNCKFVKLRLKNKQGTSNQLCWVVHPRYLAVGADPKVMQKLSIKFAGNPLLIGEQLEKDFPKEGRNVMKRFLYSSLNLGKKWLSDMTLYLDIATVSDEFLLEYYRAELLLNK